MKTDKIKIYFFEIILLTILSFALFVSNTYSRTLIAVVLIVCVITQKNFIKKRSIESVNSKKVTMILIIFAIIYLISFYAMGLYFGYYKATILFNLWSFKNYILPISAIIISSEKLRNTLLAQNIKFSKILTFIIMVLIDLLVYANIYNVNTYQKVIEIIGFSIFASIACNLLYNYTSTRYGCIGITVYRLITVLYVYIIPYIPNVYIFFRSILRMIYPYIIYQVLEYTFVTNKMIVNKKDKTKNLISKIILGVMTILIAMLISCQFKFGILVIGSGSMTGVINKGDAVIFEQYSNEEIKIGQIIIFEKNNLQIVHRVVDIKKVNKELRYITKGDSNQQNDDGYITKQDIIGVSKFKIPYIGYPSIWIRDILSNKK